MKLHTAYLRFSGELGNFGFEVTSGSHANGTARRLRVEGTPSNIQTFARVARAHIKASKTVAEAFSRLEELRDSFWRWVELRKL